MAEKMTGQCLCGASTFDFIKQPKFAIQCHCRDCQQISGGGHLPQVAVPSEKFVAHGKVKTYETVSDAGNTVGISFCGACGCSLFKATSKMPDVKFLCAGALDEDLVAEPFQRVLEDCQRVWDN
ncbi:GFA family protein [Shimia sp.]|uniref:GFA family protein n=1 Tax=Shimia sp. TaxID=1954381 RepID=UPI00329828FA